MEDKVKESLQNYAKGYTCSQAVICAYADQIGMDKELAYKVFEGFGGGFGGQQEVCGALSAVLGIISYYYSDGKLEGGQSKLDTYVKIREASELFAREFGSIVCKEVLHGEKPKPFKCGAKVRIAAEIVEKMVGEGK